MQINYVLRPRGIRSTPRRLARGWDAETIRRLDKCRRNSCDSTIFFLYYPENHPNTTLSTFCRTTKSRQREIVRNGGIPTPDSFNRESGECRFVVRPLYHRSGQGWRITENSNDFSSTTEYISPVFPKAWEYRLIWCKGTLLITLLKQVPEELGPEHPWNHSNGAFFITVENEENNRLRKTNCRELLSENNIIQQADLIAADIMLDRNYNWCVCEFNFCPSLQIEANLRKVIEHVNQLG